MGNHRVASAAPRAVNANGHASGHANERATEATTSRFQGAGMLNLRNWPVSTG